jgi:hypothetical protein
MIDRSDQPLPIQADGYFKNNVSRLRGTIPHSEIRAKREELESRLPLTPVADSSDSITPKQARHQQRALASGKQTNNTKNLNAEIKLPSSQNLQQWPNIYYENLTSMIDLLKTAKQKVEDYSEADSKDRQLLPPFHKIISSLITPYPLRDFISNNMDSTATEGELTESYLDKEKIILAKLLGHEEKSDSSQDINKESILSKNPEYLIYQARIANTLKTIDKAELNLRLSFINLYLQASFKQINHEEDPIAKEALFAKTIKFLNTNLISDSLPSKERADDYIRHLNPVISLIKKINDAVPEPTMIDQNGDTVLLSSPILALKTSLIKNIENHYENLMRIDDLSTTNRIELFKDKDNDLVSILSPILSPQQRIEKTLNTTNKTDINFKLALINLYLENSVKEIKKNDDKEIRISKFQDTVKFLDAHLPTLGVLKSTKQASEYGDLLKSTFKQLKALQESFPENKYPEFQDDKNRSQRCPSFALKNYLADIVMKQAEKIIETSHLGLQTKSEFSNNPDIADIAGKDTINRLNNHLLESLLHKKDFSISSRQGNTYPEQSVQNLNSAYQFLSENKRGATYDKNILNQVLIQDLGKSINDSSLFFKFLKLMIENTHEHFQQFQNDEIPPNLKEDFKDFKTSILQCLNSPGDKELLTATNKALTEDDLQMITSLQALMLFKDTEIQESSKAFYLKALQETKSPETLGTILSQLRIYQNFTEVKTQKSLPISLQDLNNSLNFSPVIKAIGLKQLEQNFGLKSLEKNTAGELIFSKHPVNLTETEKNILKELEDVRTNLMARKQPPLEPLI